MAGAPKRHSSFSSHSQALSTRFLLYIINSVFIQMKTGMKNKALTSSVFPFYSHLVMTGVL